MRKKRPNNLIVSTVHLTDKPYDVQVGVLRWIRTLLREVVDKAMAISPSQQQLECNLDRESGEVQMSPHVQAAVSSSGLSDGVGEGGHHEEVVDTRPCLACARDVCSVADDAAGPSDGDGSMNTLCEVGRGSGRKRARTPSPGRRDELSVGLVVECFHPGDGLWYPGEVTALLQRKPRHSSPLAAGGSTIAGEEAPSKTEVDKRNSPVQSPGEHQLEVTFLGYGDRCTVPRGWAREIVTPEVLRWCTENGVAEDSMFRTSRVLPATDIDRPSSQPGNVEALQTSAQGLRIGEQQSTAHDSKGETMSGNKGKGNKGKSKSKKGRSTAKKGACRSAMECDDADEEQRFIMRCASRSKSPLSHVPNKYWGQRYRYFSRFDDGITMDEEGWYSVTPEAIALHIAERVCCDLIVDPFVGCGGNAVQFALVCHLVFAIDVDPVKLEHARRNAAIYGVEDRIEFILGDAMKVLPTLQADAVFLSPPWGGPDYHSSQTFDMHSMIPPPLSAVDIFRAARAVTPNVIFFLPRNVNLEQVAELPAVVGSQAATEMCELERHFLNGKLKTTTAYFGEDIVAVTVDSEQAEPASVTDAAAVQLSAEEGGGGDEAVVKWSGRHVRFCDDDDDDDHDHDDSGDNEAKVKDRCRNGELVKAGSACASLRAKEDALYASWVAVQTLGRGRV